MSDLPEEAVQAAADDLEEAFKNVRFRFWTCVNKAHRYVTWTGDVASCDTCGLTSEMTSKVYALCRQIERERVAAELRAEGERERERLGDEIRNVEILNWVTAWECAARFVEGEPKRGRVIIDNDPGEARDSR